MSVSLCDTVIESSIVNNLNSKDLFWLIGVHHHSIRGTMYHSSSHHGSQETGQRETRRWQPYCILAQVSFPIFMTKSLMVSSFRKGLFEVSLAWRGSYVSSQPWWHRQNKKKNTMSALAQLVSLFFSFSFYLGPWSTGCCCYYNQGGVSLHSSASSETLSVIASGVSPREFSWATSSNNT